MNVVIKKVKKTDFSSHSNQYDVALKGFTAGMILAIRNALSVNTTPVGQDCLNFLNHAIEQNEELKVKLS